jgi:hypothetical protein
MSAALNRYAIERDEYYGALRRILDWMTELTLTSGPDADKGASGFSTNAVGPERISRFDRAWPFGPSDRQAGRLALGLD